MEESYIYYLKMAHKECIDCRDQYAKIKAALSCFDELNVKDILIRVEWIEGSVTDIKKCLAEARKQVERNLSEEDYRKNTLIELLGAFEKQLTCATSCKDILLRELADIIQDKLLDIGQEAADGSEKQCEPKPFTAKDLDITETISHLAKINMIIERLTPVINAMVTSCYQISLSGEIPDDDVRISKIEEIRQSLINTVRPAQEYSSSISKHAQPDIILCAKAELLGVLYLAFSKTVSWLNDNKDSFRSGGNIETTAWAEIASLRCFINSELALIRDMSTGDDEVSAKLSSLAAFRGAIKWHVGLLIAIMRAAMVKQV